MRVEIDKSACHSSGRCVRVAPEAFRLDDDHLAEPTAAAPALAPDRLLDLARGCPAAAIALYDDAGDEVDPFGAF